MMRLSRRQAASLAAVLLLSLLGCKGDQGEAARLHRAQREFWQARHAQRRLDIFPQQSIAEDCLARYQAIVERYPLDTLPAEALDPASRSVKLARVGAMASLGAAGILRELGQPEAAIRSLQAACRDDLPLGRKTERRLRSTLASFLVEAGQPREAMAVYRSLLEPLAPGLDPEHAAYPDDELLAYPQLMLDLASQHGGASEAAAFAGDYLDQVSRDYAGSEAEWQALLRAVDLSMARKNWRRAADLLARLAEGFPEREPWRAELKRARLLREQLGRKGESEMILDRLAKSESPGAAVAAGLTRTRLWLSSARLSEVEAEIRRLKKMVKTDEESAELLYLWGTLELRRGSWEEARPRWGQAAGNHRHTRYGMEAQYAVAAEWAERDEPRFAALALSRLYTACRRNERHHAGTELSRLAVEIEGRADSLLGTLPATVPAVQNLLNQRGQHPEQS